LKKIKALIQNSKFTFKNKCLKFEKKIKKKDEDAFIDAINGFSDEACKASLYQPGIIRTDH
jgi:hypothetical protein